MQSVYEIVALCDDRNQRIFVEQIKQKGGKILDMEFNSDFGRMEITSVLPIYQSQGFY